MANTTKINSVSNGSKIKIRQTGEGYKKISLRGSSSSNIHIKPDPHKKTKIRVKGRKMRRA